MAKVDDIRWEFRIVEYDLSRQFLDCPLKAVTFWPTLCLTQTQSLNANHILRQNWGSSPPKVSVSLMDCFTLVRYVSHARLSHGHRVVCHWPIMNSKNEWSVPNAPFRGISRIGFIWRTGKSNMSAVSRHLKCWGAGKTTISWSQTCFSGIVVTSIVDQHQDISRIVESLGPKANASILDLVIR